MEAPRVVRMCVIDGVGGGFIDTLVRCLDR